MLIHDAAMQSLPGSFTAAICLQAVLQGDFSECIAGHPRRDCAASVELERDVSASVETSECMYKMGGGGGSTWRPGRRHSEQGSCCGGRLDVAEEFACLRGRLAVSWKVMYSISPWKASCQLEDNVQYLTLEG